MNQMHMKSSLTDEQIRQILIERKKKAARKEVIEGFIGWILLFGGLYIISILGYVTGLC